MTPQIALILYFILLLFFLIIDSKQSSKVSIAVWIPSIWVLIISSRMVSQWLNINPGTTISVDNYLDGSPIDRNILTALYIIALVVLLKRNIKWSKIVSNNLWLFIFVLYCGLSIFWSDFPWISLKRYVKEIGNILIVLVVLTENEPIEAFKTIFRRLAYVHIPLSILLYKYYPHMGRTYHRWSGKMFFTGAATTKNGLGILCAVCSIFIFWKLYTMWRNKDTLNNKKIILADISILFITLWLLIKSDCATGMIISIIGILIIVLMNTNFMQKNTNRVGGYIFLATFISLGLQYTIGAITKIIIFFGRDATLTGRTDLWDSMLDFDINPIIGLGYNSFWLDNRMAILWAKYWWRPTESHNGYIDIYVNLGIVGILLFAGIIFSSFKNISNRILSNQDYGTIQMALLIIVLLYNITESSFIPATPMYFIFILTILNISYKHQQI